MELVRPEAIAQVAKAFVPLSFLSIQAEQALNGRADVIIAHALPER